MSSINITERVGDRHNENLASWYKERVKALSEVIMKRIKPADCSIEEYVNNIGKEVVVK